MFILALLCLASLHLAQVGLARFVPTNRFQIKDDITEQSKRILLGLIFDQCLRQGMRKGKMHWVKLGQICIKYLNI